ncbi:DNA/RNA non-specific endonuclease [Niallia circulans]|uniref:DNA/RNA non-specific endonuclease n=2 Tax=Niallia TaxID=2837506 RepID=UPI00300ADF24
MYVSGSAATSFLPYVGQAKYLKLLKGEKSKNKANEIRSAISQKTTKSLQRIDGSKKENSLWPNGIKNSGKQYVQEVTHFFRQTLMPHPSFQLSTANQAPINVWSRATIENRMDSIVPASLRKVEGKGTTKGTGNGNIVNEVKEIDFGKHIIKGENGKKQLLPNTKYVTNDNYKYTTDELGRIVNVDAPELVLKKANRNKYAQANVGGRDRLPDDDGGHLIGAQFNGPPDIDNLVPQNSQINRRGGVWYEMETEWANALKELPPKKVSVSIEPIYSNNSMRPDSFMVEYEIEGQFPVIHEIANKSGG